MSRGPRRAKILGIVAVLGVLYFGLVILLLSVLTTDFEPITEPASLYGIGPYATVMNSGFFLGGIGMLAFALAVWSPVSSHRSRVGAVLLFMAGLVLIMDSYFTTDPVQGPTTTHGIIHAFGGLLFFTTGPIGILLVARKFGVVRLVVTLLALLGGAYLLVANLNLGGLAERLIILIIFASVVIDSLGIATS